MPRKLERVAGNRPFAEGSQAFLSATYVGEGRMLAAVLADEGQEAGGFGGLEQFPAQIFMGAEAGNFAEDGEVQLRLIFRADEEEDEVNRIFVLVKDDAMRNAGNEASGILDLIGAEMGQGDAVAEGGWHLLSALP